MGRLGEHRHPPMPPEDDARDRGGGGWWRIERIEERQKDMLGKLDHQNGQIDLLLKRGEERGWKLDAMLAEIQRGIREAKEAVEKRALTNPDIVKILAAGLVALSVGNWAVKAFLG